MSDRSVGPENDGNVSNISELDPEEFVEAITCALKKITENPDFDSEGPASTGKDITVGSNLGSEAARSDSRLEQNLENQDATIGEGNNFSYFEGAEKLIEVVFARLDGKTSDCSLRRIPRTKLEEMLAVVRCQIIDSASNEEIDSYVLSESSLFVSKKWIIIKTCGTTTPLECLPLLWNLVKEFTGFDCIEDVYYSHKNFNRPNLQEQAYRKFDSEVAILDNFFVNSDASVYCLGSINRDCWYLYTYHHPCFLINGRGEIMQRFDERHHHSSGEGHLTLCGSTCKSIGDAIVKQTSHTFLQAQNQSFHPISQQRSPDTDQTLEILMSFLDPQIMQIFTKKKSSSAKDATKNSGIDRIIPGMVINDSLFEPCGYSMNGIMKNGTYMTIHITPESGFSYVSFETNISLSSYRELINSVVSLFNPGKFVLTFFANKASNGYVGHEEMKDMNILKKRWVRQDNQFCRLKKDDLTYAFYKKMDN